jgi:hypothetical protein
MVKQLDHDQPLVSRRPANVVEDTLPKRMLSAEFGLSMATSSSRKSSPAEIPVPVDQVGAFKNCCLQSGRFDGRQRDHYF